MIITCPCEKKKFDVDASLIPVEGKMLQCGACDRKWFYKEPAIKKTKKKNLPTKTVDLSAGNTEIPSETESIITEAENNKQTNDEMPIKQNRVSLLNLIIVFIISLIALVLLLDTFKFPINNFSPGFIFLLDNFYLTLNDIFLFFKDLIRE